MTAAALAQWLADGGPGWINLLVLVCIWSALEFLVNGPVTLVRLVRVRVVERRYRSAGLASNGALSIS